MLGWGNGCLWCQTTQHSLRLSLSQCGHVSVISHVSYSSACSFTAPLPWRQDGREVAVMTVNWELNWKRGVWRTDFMSSKCKRSTRPAVCSRRQPWATHFAMLQTPKELWLTAIEKCITLKLCQAMCLHHLNSQTHTDTHLLWPLQTMMPVRTPV